MSPSANTIDWPERTGLSNSSDPVFGFSFSSTTAGFELTGISAQSRPPLNSGGRSGASADCSTPSRPSTRIERSDRLVMRWRIAEADSEVALKSSITGLAVKKPGDFESVASTSSSHSTIGTCGAST